MRDAAIQGLLRWRLFGATRKGLVEHVLSGCMRASRFAIDSRVHLLADRRTGMLCKNTTRRLCLGDSVVARLTATNPASWCPWLSRRRGARA